MSDNFDAFSNPNNTVINGALTVKSDLGAGGTSVSFDNGAIQSDGFGDLIVSSIVTTGTGATTNVKGYGALGNGSHNDTTNIQAAINATQAGGGGIVFFPPGTYVISSPLTITSHSIMILGSGIKATIIQPTSGFSGAGALVITGASDGQIRDITFQAISNTYTSNPACDAIQVNHSNGWALENIYVNNWNGWAIEFLNDSSGNCYFPSLINVHVGTCKQGIHIKGDFADNNYNSGAYLANCNVGGTQNGDGLLLEDIHDITITNLEGGSATGGNTIHLVGFTYAVYVSNFDLGTLVGSVVAPVATVLIESNGNGSPNQIAFNGGILEDGIYNAQITAGADITFTNVQFVRGGTYGVNVTGTGTDRVTFNACSFILNGYTAGASHYDINCTTSGHTKLIGCTFSTPQGSLSGQVTAACNFTTGTSEVLSCSFLGANGATTFASLPTVVRGCQGYNPLGNISVSAVGTSPYTAPVRSTDMTVFITGGTVSSIAIGGVNTGVTSGAFRVPAGQTITITHTGAPTWTWFGD